MFIFSRPSGITDFEWHLTEHQICRIIRNSSNRQLNIQGHTYPRHLTISGTNFDLERDPIEVGRKLKNWDEIEISYQKNIIGGRIWHEIKNYESSLFAHLENAFSEGYRFYDFCEDHETLSRHKYIFENILDVSHIEPSFALTRFRNDECLCKTPTLQAHAFSHKNCIVHLSIPIADEHLALPLFLILSDYENLFPTIRQKLDSLSDEIDFTYLIRTRRHKDCLQIRFYLFGEMNRSIQFIRENFQNINVNIEFDLHKQIANLGQHRNKNSIFLNVAHGHLTHAFSEEIWKQIATTISESHFDFDIKHSSSNFETNLNMRDLRIIEELQTVSNFIFVSLKHSTAFASQQEFNCFIVGVLNSEIGQLIMSHSYFKTPPLLAIAYCSDPKNEEKGIQALNDLGEIYGASGKTLLGNSFFCGISFSKNSDKIIHHLNSPHNFTFSVRL